MVGGEIFLCFFVYLNECCYFYMQLMTSYLDQVTEVRGEDVVCLIKNSAVLASSLYTLHVSQIRIDLPTLTDDDKKVC